MNWVLENLQLILVIAGSIAYWLNQRRREREGQSADYDEDGVPEAPARPVVKPGADALEEDQRTRRIQEEIRRKIMERRGLSPETPPRGPFDPEPQPDLRPPVFEEPEPEPAYEPAPRPVVTRVEPPPLDDAVLARQRELQERLAALSARRAAAAAEATALRGSADAPPVSGTPVSAMAAALRRDLREPASARKAILLSEVLRPPVALR